ncbi:MAG: 3-methyl-2-oxobutanoate hydroxymethyltransferase [Planctomycetes bacterium]|jgi:3-methyl-2-oxobutanoate hydroxymethyltransferase|nr:3-methyl-2-oxobutanoate hydroxymethyltransferase [Planctomycetota bacterium]MBT4028755.1 3-methyl-2-oxobutanoate hydroxymethyltransferase [Planctomycetota bacterium]MBT4560199.1 3-methyl-2-oxobutanoate hydroxymethyltransferase [Planctomycetota bacterium]MBT5100931.1 3-methyl-2-oxobutanoate hydroxymethyltransferase [Planctomycetota bacterium]MBT7318210.1 3-methyl-2-oxobutanoate hydroxymethyltransferase [Planctomycetota bacterium]
MEFRPRLRLIGKISTVSSTDQKPIYGSAPSTQTTPRAAKVTVPSIRNRKGTDKKVLCLTAYDYPSARLVDEAGFDLILVGDSMANVVLGHASTLKISLEQIISATRAVKRGADRPLIVADMPYGTYHISAEDTIRNGLRLVREGGAQAVKIEGGVARAKTVKALVEADIPVLGHIGLLPQSTNTRGGYRISGRTVESARALLEDALAIQDAGAFAVVLEGVPEAVATRISERLEIPTIGIGAGDGCDGQILVFHDALGLSFGPAPRFVKRYANLADMARKALSELANDMGTGCFPTSENTYPTHEELPDNWDQ